MLLIKRLIVGLMVLLLGSACLASTIGYRLEKTVNGGWEHDYIINYTIGGQYQAYLDTKAVFLAPRSNPMAANHEYFGVDIGAKVNVFGFDVAGGTGSRWMWEGNSQGLPAGYCDWNNYISITKDIN